MNSEERNRFAEELVEAGLARYRNVAPLPGLEERLLAGLEPSRMRADALSELCKRMWQQKMRSLIAKAVWAALLAASAVAFYVVYTREAIKPRSAVRALATSIPTENARPARIAPSLNITGRADIGSTPLARPHAAKGLVSGGLQLRRRPQSWEGPRSDQFPTPEPLNEQEKLLLSYIRQTPAPPPISFHDPDELRKELQPRPLEAMRIEPPKPGGSE